MSLTNLYLYFSALLGAFLFSIRGAILGDNLLYLALPPLAMIAVYMLHTYSSKDEESITQEDSVESAEIVVV